MKKFTPQNTQEYVVWLIKLGQLLTKQLNRSLAERYDLTFNQVHILFAVQYCTQQKQSFSLQQLAQRLTVSLPNVTALVGRLQTDGYLQKKVAPDDRRKHYLVLTARGNQLLRTLKKNWPPRELVELDQFFKTLSGKQRQHFNDTLLAITHYLRACDEKVH